MFGFFKRPASTPDSVDQTPDGALPAPPELVQALQPLAVDDASLPSPDEEAGLTLPESTPSPALASRSKGRVQRVLLNLKEIIDAFSPQMQEVLAKPPSEKCIVALPIEGILDQLATGRVEVSIGELRRISPASVFIGDTGRDEERVEIPLRELLSKLDPDLLERHNITIVDLPSDIEGVFESKLKQPGSETPAPPVETRSDAVANAPSAESQTTPEPAATSEAEKKPESMPPPLPPSAPPIVRLAASDELKALFQRPPESSPTPESLSSGPSEAAPPQPVRPPVGTDELKALFERPLPAVTATTPAPEQPAPELAALPAPESKPLPAPTPEPVWTAPAVALAPPKPVSPVVPPDRAPQLPNHFGESAPVIRVSLKAVSRGWPEAIREETASLPRDTFIDFPTAELGAALKRGLVSFCWSQLRTWMLPKIAAESMYDDAVLNVPVEVVAPLFMEAVNPTQSAARVQIDEEIPAPFAAMPKQPEAAPARPILSAPGDRPVIASENSPVDTQVPVQTIERACSFSGVAGAIVCSRDGLLVAAKLPPELNAASVATVVPQIFCHLEEVTMSMQVGDLHQAAFTAEDRAWLFFKAGALLLGAVGDSNAVMPSAQLKMLATQLARHTRS